MKLRRRVVRSSVAALSCLLSGAIAACTGQIGSRPGDPFADGGPPSADGSPLADGALPTDARTPVAPAFRCDPAQTPLELPLRRLGRAQYTNAIDHAVRAIDGALVGEVRTAIAPFMDRYPQDHLGASIDGKHGGYASADQTVQQQHIDLSYDVATRVGEVLTRDAARIGRVFGACATDTNTANDAACIDAFLDSFAARALRRPLSAEDKTFYRTAIGGRTAAADLADLVALVLSAPQFLYHVEHGAAMADRPTRFQLDPWELAARLSFHFWQEPPDEALREAARTGALATDAGFAAQVQRLFDDPRTERALDRFFREYLWLDTLPSLDSRVGDPVFDAFRAEVSPSPALRNAMIDDVLSSARNTIRTGGALTALFDDRRSYARDATLAGIYRTPVWSGTGDAPTFTEAQRAGLLTRAAFLSTGTINTRPIIKGVFIRIGLLCDPIPAPPNNAAATPIPMLEMRTTRQVVEALTEAEGTPCAGCHSSLINPLGFASENFDALGRARATQRFFDAMGRVVGEAPVNTRSTPLVSGSDPRETADAVQLTRTLIESNRLQACFARQYFRFTFGRLERTDGSDDCALSRLHDAALAGRPLGEVLRVVAMDPAFRSRSFQ
ncbi:MAG: DUF1592 domain-containing protein [Myxococcales bacterium]|nr:DUF1592 domain-containing protein [Myxococcales bacterium]